MFQILFVFYLIKTIYYISGGVEEIFSPDEGIIHKVNLEEFCPCDKTAEVCDLKCCCDEDCLLYMLDKDYYDKYSECDSLSYVNNRIDSRLDYCEGYKKSIDDLYNPLVLAFKILKKGFCLAKKNPKSKNNDKDEIYKGLIDEIESDQNIGSQNIDFSEVLPSTTDIDFDQFKNIGNFEKMAFNAPISLPNGLCLFNSYPVKKFMDYEVECSYHYSQIQEIIEKFDSRNIETFLIENSFYSKNSNAREGNYIKKVEIIYFQENGNKKINHYYENIDLNENDGYIDFTFVVTFLKNESDNIRSGNPGYIKGKPILISQKRDNKIYKFKNDIVFPIDNNINIQQEHNAIFYFDNYFDNKITFEDFIIYGYSNFQKTEISNLVDYINNNINNNKIVYGIFGNANMCYLEDWKEMDLIKNKENPYLLIGLYKDVGASNNTQFQIIEFNRKQFNDPLYLGTKYYYFITKFLKLKTEKDWWYARGPGFIKLPKNIMYPFRIGTTDYESKK